MTDTAKPLTFGAVDALAFGASTGKLQAISAGAYAPTSLGPLLEFLFLTAGRRLPAVARSWLFSNGATPLITAIHEGRESWVNPDARRSGFIVAQRKGPDADNRLLAFLMDAQRAARDVALLPGKTPGQLVAAMQELESNIHEHSEAPESGLLAYRAVPGVFEFVAADGGIGVLASLRSCPKYAALQDNGKALAAVLTDGTSRFGSDSRRGHGFRPIFLGLVNLRGALRFRSGDHALIMDGTSPNLTTAQLAQKPAIDGFSRAYDVTEQLQNDLLQTT